VRLRKEGRSWGEIETETGVNSRTCRHWVSIQVEEGRTTKKQRGGNHNAVYSDELKQRIIEKQESDAALRLCDLAKGINDELHVTSPSLTTIWRIIHEVGFTTKKLEQYATDRNTLQTKQKRAKWCTDIGSTLQSDTCIFIDETPFSFCIMRSRGRSRKGQRALGVVPAIRGRNHTVIAAISPTHGLIHYEIKITEPDQQFLNKKSKKKVKTAPRGVDRERFRQFLINLLALPLFHTSTRFKIILNNARIHKGDIVDDIFQSGHELQFLPPWSPELNPIEYIFGKWKMDYRIHYPATEQQVDPAIQESAKSITPAQCKHCFEHTQSLYATCVAMEDL
jgi:transposase